MPTKPWAAGDRCLAPLGYSGNYAPGVIRWVERGAACVELEGMSGSVVCETGSLRERRK